MLYHIGMTNGQQPKTVTVRADRFGDAQEAAMRANPGFQLTGQASSEHEPEPQEAEVVEEGDE